MLAVIMAGGKGTRFWPRSVEDKPKQFLALTESNKTMLQLTYQRFRKWLSPEAIYVVTARRYLDLVHDQLPELDEERLIIEPEQRDTSACTAMAALYFIQRGMDDVLVFAPSDQHIPDEQELREVLELAERKAATGCDIVTLGIVPTRPETGFGYLQAVPPTGNERLVPIHAFLEKPPAETAARLIQQPHVYWNSGIYVWKPSTIAHYMQKEQSVMWNQLAACRSMAEVDEVYAGLSKLSIDYAVIEKAKSVYTIPVSFVWDDVGLWTSLERIRPADAEGNLIHGDVKLARTTNSIIHTDGQQTVVLGVSDLVIVSTAEGLLVCHKSEENQIKVILEGWKK